MRGCGNTNEIERKKNHDRERTNEKNGRERNKSVRMKKRMRKKEQSIMSIQI